MIGEKEDEKPEIRDADTARLLRRLEALVVCPDCHGKQCAQCGWAGFVRVLSD